MSACTIRRHSSPRCGTVSRPLCDSSTNTRIGPERGHQPRHREAADALEAPAGEHRRQTSTPPIRPASLTGQASHGPPPTVIPLTESVTIHSRRSPPDPPRHRGAARRRPREHRATEGFGVSKPAITKQLEVLEETGVVTRDVDGRTIGCRSRPGVLAEAADWMDRQRARGPPVRRRGRVPRRRTHPMTTPPTCAEECTPPATSCSSRRRSSPARATRSPPSAGGCVAVEKDYSLRGPRRPGEPARPVRGSPPADRVPLLLEPGVQAARARVPGLLLRRRPGGAPRAPQRARHHARVRLARAAGRHQRGADGLGHPWYTITDDFDTDFGVAEWHGTNAFLRDGDGCTAPTSSTAAATSRWEHLGLPRHHRARTPGGVGGLARGIPQTQP